MAGSRGTRRVWIVNGALVLLVLLALGGTVAVLTASGTSDAATVRTVPVGRGTVTETVTAAGTVTSASTSTVNAPAGGTIASVRVALGDRVARGDTLLTLDGESARATLRAARSQLTAARRQLTAATDARDAGTGTTGTGTTGTGTAGAGAAGAGATGAGAAGTGTTGAGTTGTTPGSASPTGTPTAGTGATGTGATGSGATGTGGTGSGGTGSGGTGSGGTGSGTSTASADAQVAQARASVAQAQSQVVTAENAADDLTVTAPQDGTVVTLDARVGQTAGAGATTTTSGAGASGGSSSSGSSAGGASAAGAGAGAAGAGAAGAAASAAGGGTSLVTVADLDGLEVRADVPELDVARIATGQPATVAVNALPGQELPGAVSAVDTLPATGTSVQYGTAVTLTAAPPGLRPGMSASVSVIVRRASDTPFLPSVAVTPIGGPGGTSATVQVMGADGQARARTVGVGLTSDTTTQVTSGLAPGELVVLPDAGLQPLQRGGPPGTQGGGANGSGGGGGG